MARDRELAQFQSYIVRARRVLRVQHSAHAAVDQKSTVNIRFDHMHDRLRQLPERAAHRSRRNGVFAGAEPLYKLNANVFQLFVSICSESFRVARLLR